MRIYHVVGAAHDHMVSWMRDGTPPPTAPRIETVSPTPPTTIARDDLGLAKGGIRIADLAVPTALNTGSNSGPAFCLLFGTHVPFDDATLDALYPRAGDYVGRVAQVVSGNLADGYITREAAQATRVDAAQSGVGR